jgi:hypothetical protein
MEEEEREWKEDRTEQTDRQTETDVVAAVQVFQMLVSGTR